MKLLTGAGVVVLLSGVASAQWAIDPSENRQIANRTGDQVQPKVVPDAFGGCYISWFDNFSGGYDVRVQNVDALGFDRWAANGVEICNRSVSSTIDYDLIPLSGGGAAIAYTEDTRTPGSTQQVTVQVVNPDGSTRWPAPGITLTSDTLFKGNPHVAELSTGELVVGWSSGSPQSWTFQKLSPSGAPQFPAPGINVAEASRYLALSDIQPANNGGFIALWIRGTTANAITSAKALYSQKYDNAGQAQWNGGNPVIVFNTTSVQNGYFPTFVADGVGGAVFAWYEIGGARNSYVQHITTDGTPRFAAPVATTGTTTGRIRVGAGLAYDAAADVYYVASPDTDGATQSTFRVLVQRISSLGAREWGNDGTVVIAQNSNQPSFVQCQPTGDGCTVMCIDARSATTHVIFAAGVDSEGTMVWNNLASPTVAAKSRLTSTLVGPGQVVLAFGNGSTGTTDIWAQNLNADGSYGVAPVIRSTSPADVTLCRGGSTTLAADGAGSAPLTVAWTRNGEPVSSTGSDLFISNATNSSAGEYVCTFTNPLGHARASFTLSVCFADFDCSEGVDSDDVIAFFGAWDAGQSSADVNDDAGVDSDDVILFFEQWDAGC